MASGSRDGTDDGGVRNGNDTIAAASDGCCHTEHRSCGRRRDCGTDNTTSASAGWCSRRCFATTSTLTAPAGTPTTAISSTSFAATAAADGRRTRTKADLCECEAISADIKTARGAVKDGRISHQEESLATKTTTGKQHRWWEETVHARIATPARNETTKGIRWTIPYQSRSFKFVPFHSFTAYLSTSLLFAVLFHIDLFYSVPLCASIINRLI